MNEPLLSAITSPPHTTLAVDTTSVPATTSETVVIPVVLIVPSTYKLPLALIPPSTVNSLEADGAPINKFLSIFTLPPVNQPD